MRTIDSILAETYSYINVQKQIARDSRIQSCYKAFPELERIDSDLIKARADKFIAAIDSNSEYERELSSREARLQKERIEFIDKHGIDPEFDEIKVQCSICGDTGYHVNDKGARLVCECRKDDLETCYAACGMKDYSTYTLKSYDNKYCGDGNKRKVVLKSLVKLMKEGNKQQPLCLYSDGARTGKTYLAVCIVKAAISMGKSSVYSKCERLGELSSEELDDYKDCEFLVLDDYAPEITRKYRDAIALNELLESRMATGKTTVLVSASPKAVLVAESDARIAGKINQAVTV